MMVDFKRETAILAAMLLATPACDAGSGGPLDREGGDDRAVGEAPDGADDQVEPADVDGALPEGWDAIPDFGPGEGYEGSADVNLDVDDYGRTGCSSDEQCPDHPVYGEGWCDRRCWTFLGACRHTPTVEDCQTSGDNFMCGCDGVTYRNDCERWRTHAGMRYMGPCTDVGCPAACWYAPEDVLGRENHTWVDSCTGDYLCPNWLHTACWACFAECRDDPIRGPSWFAVCEEVAPGRPSGVGCIPEDDPWPADYIGPAAGGTCP